ncbi:unnamed protein product [Cyprideis torosa]|uniref:Uncharacterized protein n=1 Tax=Cyprideis torosa TaxID=163714 RepID=A0A7R8WDI6_9CRUS|nr:unnamed protein product [Cyprideis torosa]CAG0893211.1 unnamed protein product [Cyprideis torosa]
MSSAPFAPRFASTARNLGHVPDVEVTSASVSANLNVPDPKTYRYHHRISPNKTGYTYAFSQAYTPFPSPEAEFAPNMSRSPLRAPTEAAPEPQPARTSLLTRRTGTYRESSRVTSGSNVAIFDDPVAFRTRARMALDTQSVRSEEIPTPTTPPGARGLCSGSAVRVSGSDQGQDLAGSDQGQDLAGSDRIRVKIWQDRIGSGSRSGRIGSDQGQDLTGSDRISDLGVAAQHPDVLCLSISERVFSFLPPISNWAEGALGKYTEVLAGLRQIIWWPIATVAYMTAALGVSRSPPPTPYPADYAASSGPPADYAASFGPPADHAASFGPPGDYAASFGPPTDHASSSGPPADHAASFGPPADPPADHAASLSSGNGLPPASVAIKTCDCDQVLETAKKEFLMQTIAMEERMTQKMDQWIRDIMDEVNHLRTDKEKGEAYFRVRIQEIKEEVEAQGSQNQAVMFQLQVNQEHYNALNQTKETLNSEVEHQLKQALSAVLGVAVSDQSSPSVTNSGPSNSSFWAQMRNELRHKDEEERERVMAEISESVRQSILATLPSPSKQSQAEIAAMIRQALDIYDADKTGMSDFALESAGEGTDKKKQVSRLEEGGEIAEAYDLTQYNLGQEGHVTIELAAWTLISGFTVEHIPRSLRFEMKDSRSVPKDIAVIGLFYDGSKAVGSSSPTVLANFTFQEDGEARQYFPIQDVPVNIIMTTPPPTVHIIMTTPPPTDARVALSSTNPTEGSLTWNSLRSQTLMAPSSPPETMNGSLGFQEITFTSFSWQFGAVIMHALAGGALMSQIRIL